jgi:hypothetical protein
VHEPTNIGQRSSGASQLSPSVIASPPQDAGTRARPERTLNTQEQTAIGALMLKTQAGGRDR